LWRCRWKRKRHQENYCEDQDTNFKWEALVLKFPDDMQIQTLHALRLGLCLKVDRGDIMVSQASELFNKIRNAFNNKKLDGKENELVESKNKGK